MCMCICVLCVRVRIDLVVWDNGPHCGIGTKNRTKVQISL